MKLDDATPTAGQYDPAQAATNARTMVSDKAYVAALGPQMSGAGKAMAPILSQGNLAIITTLLHQPGPDGPEVRRPVQAPAGKAIYFRNRRHGRLPGPQHGQLHGREAGREDHLRARRFRGAYGVGLADAFQAQIEKKGVKVLGRDRLDPKAADYSARS